MQLVALLLVALIVGVLSNHFGLGSMFAPAEKAPQPSQTIQPVEKRVEAAGQADQQRLEEAMKAVR
jgi:hypothetical protein